MPLESNNPVPVGLFRRLFAISYDLFLLTALLFIVSAVANALNSGEAILPSHPLYPLYVFVLMLFSFLYFGWFWHNGGQTPGMKTWKMQLFSRTNNNPSWQQVSIRFVIAVISWLPCGLGFIWSLFHRQRLTWHDMASQTRLIDLRK